MFMNVTVPVCNFILQSNGSKQDKGQWTLITRVITPASYSAKYGMVGTAYKNLHTTNICKNLFSIKFVRLSTFYD